MYSEQPLFTDFQNSEFQRVTPEIKQVVDKLYGSQPSLLKGLFYLYTFSHDRRLT